MAHNLLTDRLPAEIPVCGRPIPIRTDFRRWILVIELLSEEAVPAGMKLDWAAKLICPDRDFPGAANSEKAYRSFADGLAWFAACGRTMRPSGGRPGTVPAEPVFDFTQDAERILAAFRQTYGIDLGDPAVTLHFWTFMALLRNLPRETEFMRIVNLRMTDTAKIVNDDLRREVRRARAAVRIRGHRERKETEGIYG